MGNIVYDIRWSDQVDAKFEKDYRDVCSEVFHIDYTPEQFNRKFINNIYGSSVLVVVYIDSIPSAARALWRNDIENKEAYQPCDTCVKENCRGKGVFSIMTKKSIAFLPESAIIYNFPNPNSYLGYIKMGWTLVKEYNLCLLYSYKKYIREHPFIMDSLYAKWWIAGRNLYYTKVDGHYFIMHKDQRPFCYRILAEVEKEIACDFPHVTLGLFFYKSERITWYNRRYSLSHVVCRDKDISYIPTWKIDAV